jgi:hypothetical protein
MWFIHPCRHSSSLSINHQSLLLTMTTTTNSLRHDVPNVRLHHQSSTKTNHLWHESPKAKSSLPPTTVTANDDEQPTAQRLKREAPPPSDVWSIMTSKDMPQTRKPQFGHLKGKALYHQVKELPLWVMMQDFALWFSTKDIILQWLSVVHGINPNRNTKVDPDPMLTAMAKYGFPPPGILLRSPTVLSENAGISQFLCHSLSDRATFAYKGPSSVHSMVVSATFARSNHACTSERVVFSYRCLNN